MAKPQDEPQQEASSVVVFPSKEHAAVDGAKSMMNVLRRHVRWLVAVVIVAAVAGAYLWWRAPAETAQFVTAPATRGSVSRAVVATGTVNPVVTVQVGTYVSGVIKELHCDFNTHVKAGQLCAKIDPRPYQLTVDQAAANLASSQAQLAKDQATLVYAQLNFERDSKLLTQGVVSQDTVDSDKSALDQAKAQVSLDNATIQQRQAALNAAKVNLDYTNIISPVDGIVVSRNVDVGQTVAASFQTPTLFLIAKDLTKMQVDTNVSESDVGGVKLGDKASFTVEAYPNLTFWGKVTQVRQAPITVQNVVTYDVVVGVDNPELKLLPGMTANTRIVTDERNDVLRVPVSALRFSPTGVQQAAGGESAGAAKPPAGDRVWVLRNGQPHPVPVTRGLSDGTYVEIVGSDLKPDDPVIVNEVKSGDKAGGSSPARPPFRL